MYYTKKRNKNTILFFSIFLISILPIIFKTLNLHSGFSSTTCTALTTLILFFCYCVNANKILSVDFLVLTLINIASLLITISFRGAVGVSIIYLNILLLLQLLNNATFTKRQCQFLHLCIALPLLFWILSLNTELAWKAYVCEPDGTYVNPCTMAIITLACFYHFIIFFDLTIRTKWLRNIAYIVLSLFAIYFIDTAVCRASLMSLFAYWGLSLFQKKIATNYKMVLTAILLFSFIFPIVYIGLYYLIGNINFFGKNLFTGRQIVWSSVYENILEFPIFGAGSGNTIANVDNGFMDDAHNLFLGIWKNIGIIPVISIFLMFLFGKNLSSISGTNKKAKIMFLTCFIVSTVETVFNGSEYYIFYITLLITVNTKEQFSKNKKQGVKGRLPLKEYDT